MPLTVHWVENPTAADGLIEGALWATATAFDKLFGSVLGALLFEDVVNRQVWDGIAWQDVA